MKKLLLHIILLCLLGFTKAWGVTPLAFEDNPTSAELYDNGNQTKNRYTLQNADNTVKRPAFMVNVVDAITTSSVVMCDRNGTPYNGQSKELTVGDSWTVPLSIAVTFSDGVTQTYSTEDNGIYGFPFSIADTGIASIDSRTVTAVSAGTTTLPIGRQGDHTVSYNGTTVTVPASLYSDAVINLNVTDATPNTGLNAVTVGGNTYTSCGMVAGTYTYTFNNGGALVITPASSTATVQVAAARSTTCDPADPTAINRYVDAPGSVVLPATTGQSNYYYVKVTDTKGSNTATSYYCIRVYNPTPAGELKIIDQTMEWSTTKNNWGSETKYGSNALVLDNYMQLYANNSDPDKELTLYPSGLYFYGSTQGTNRRIAEIKVAGAGTLKLICHSSKSNTNTDSDRWISVKKKDGNGDFVDLDEGKKAIADGVEVTFNCSETEPTSLYMLSTGGISINSLIWTPAAVEYKTPEITWHGTTTVEVGNTINDMYASLSYKGLGMDALGVTYTVVSGGSAVGLSDGATITPNSGRISLTGVHRGTVVLSATSTAVEDFVSATTNRSIFVTGTSDIIKSLGINGNYPTPEDADGLTALYKFTSGGVLSYTISAGASIQYATTVSKTMVIDPSALSYTSTQPTIVVPDQAGLSNYYYIKTTLDSKVEYYCVQAFNDTPLPGGIKIIDRYMHFGNGNTPFTDTRHVYTSSSLVDENPYIYAYGTSNRYVSAFPNYMAFARQGQFLDDGTPSNGIIEIRVLGPGTLKIAANTSSARTTDEIVVDKVVNGVKSNLGRTTAPHQGYYPMVYDGNDVATFYIYPTSTGFTLNDLIWEPENTKAIPTIEWFGHDAIYVGDALDNYATTSSDATITYTVINSGGPIAKGHVFSLKDGKLDFAPYLSGVIVVAATVAETSNYQAYSKPITINVSKRTPTLEYSIDWSSIYTMVGGKLRNNSSSFITLSASKTGNISASGQFGKIDDDQGEYIITADNKFATVIEGGSIAGLSIGNADITITWQPVTQSCKDKYNSITETKTIRVLPGTLALSFAKANGNVAMGRSVAPAVIAKNELGEEVPELTFAYQLPSASLASLNADANIITAGYTPGTLENITAKYTGATAIDNNPAGANYITTTTSANTQSGAIKTFTLNIERVATTGRLTMIYDEPPFYGDNLASMTWSNETNTSGADASIYAPRLVMDCKYISADNRFRIDVKGTEKLVNDEHAAGIQLTDGSSSLCFYAQGSARLQLSGFASVARTLEIYAVNKRDYAGWEDHDPTFADAEHNLVGRLSIPAGKFTAEETYIDLAEAGSNYYFLTTTTGGLTISTIDWVQAKMRPYIIAPETITIAAGSQAVSVMDHDVQAYTYATNSDSHQDSERKYWIYDNTSSNLASANSYPVEFTYYTYDTDIVDIDPLSGVITPKKTGTATVYIELEAGKVPYTPTVGSATHIDYGTQRQAISVIVPVGIGILSAEFDADEIVYSTVTSPSNIWQTPTVSANGTQITDHSVSYHLQYTDGTNITDTSIASVATDGTVTISNASALNGKSIQVVADVTKSGYAGVQAYYTVRVTTGLTLPMVTYDASIGLKELETPTFTNTLPGGEDPDRRREYYMRANYQKENNKNEGVTADNVVLTFTIPTTTPGISMKYGANFDNTPATDVTITNGTATITITNPGKAQTNNIWVQLSANGEVWNGFYRIKFVAIPSAAISGAVTDKTRTATFTSNNSGYHGQLYYTFDSSTPGSDSHRYTAPINRKSNAVFNVVEVFTPHADGFTDGSYAFTTNVLYNMELEINDENVIEVKGKDKDTDAGALEPNWDKELRIPLTGAIEARTMMGGDDVEVFKDASTKFTLNGLTWDHGKDFDPGIPSYIDIYKFYSQASNNGNKDSNPWTEYNKDFGGEGTGLGDNTPAPYITPVSGAFFRIEPEYNGIVTIWIRQNGASASSAWSNTHNNDNTHKDPSASADQLKKEQESYRLMRRPVYIMDETGNLIKRNTAAYSPEWDFDGTANDDGTIIDKKKAYRNINGTVADVSQQSTLDRDFMWAWNNMQNMANSHNDVSRWERNWYAMKFYNMKYRFGKSMPDFTAKPSGLGGSGTDNYDKFNINKGDDADVGEIPIVDIIYCENAQTDLEGQSFVLYGYELPMPNYVRYRIPVKAGKTYYMGGRQTKNAFCAVKFDNDHTTDNLVSYTLNEDDDNSWTSDGSVKDGQQINVTINRTFSKGKWSPIVLPFSVSESRLRDMFGDDVAVLTLDQYYKYSSGFEMPAAVYVNSHGVTADLMFTRHHYQMLYANTPAYICPSYEWSQVAGRTAAEVKALQESTMQDDEGMDCKTSVTFPRVTFVAGGVKETNIGSGYVVTGSYGASEADDNGDMYYLSNSVDSSGKYKAKMYHAANGIDMKATRCWISKRGGMNAPALTHLGMSRHDGTSLITDDMSGIIDEAVIDTVNEAWDSDPCVYNLQGIVVARVAKAADIEAVLSRLSPGIYIYQGNKYATK